MGAKASEEIKRRQKMNKNDAHVYSCLITLSARSFLKPAHFF